MLLGVWDARIEGLGFQESPKASNWERNMLMNLVQEVWGRAWSGSWGMVQVGGDEA